MAPLSRTIRNLKWPKANQGCSCQWDISHPVLQWCLTSPEMPPLDLYDLRSKIWDPEGYPGCLSSNTFILYSPIAIFCLSVSSFNACYLLHSSSFLFFHHQHPQSLLWHVLPRALHVEQVSQNITMHFILNYYNSLEHLCETLSSCMVKILSEKLKSLWMVKILVKVKCCHLEGGS